MHAKRIVVWGVFLSCLLNSFNNFPRSAARVRLDRVSMGMVFAYHADDPIELGDNVFFRIRFLMYPFYCKGVVVGVIPGNPIKYVVYSKESGYKKSIKSCNVIPANCLYC